MDNKNSTVAGTSPRASFNAYFVLPTACTTTEVNVPGWVSGRYRAGFRFQLWKM
jgi:hypothetical protein